MTKNLKLLLFFVLLVLSYGNSMGQDFIGSSYSIFGIGELRPQGGIQSRGMGYTGIALSSTEWLNTLNPASNVRIKRFDTHVFDFGLYAKNVNASDGSQSESFGQGNVTNINYFFRYNTKWVGLIGASQYSTVGYSVFDTFNEGTNNEIDVTYRGGGGISQIFFTNSVNLYKNLDIGVRLNYVFGQIVREEVILQSFGAQNYIDRSEDTYAKVLFDFGVNYSIVTPKFVVVLGGIYDNGGQLNRTVGSSFSNSIQVLSEDETSGLSQELPRKYGVGVSFINNNFTVAADIEINEWGSIDSDRIGFEYEDTYRYSFGMEFVPDRKGSRLYQRMGYRAGGYVRNNYFSVNERSFNIFGLTSGISIPFKSGGLLNLSYHFNTAGRTSNGLIREVTNELSLDVSIHSLWFVKPKYN